MFQRFKPYLSALSLSLGIGVIVAAVFIAYLSGVRVSLDETSINWSGPQEKAAITLSDPQVYSREALINDRRRETEFLEKLLEESENENFLPHVQRTINTVNSIKGSINATVSREAASDPALSAERQSSPTEKREPKASEQNAPPEKQESKTKANGYPQERFRDLQAYRNDIRASLARTALDDLHDYNGQALYRLQFRTTVLPGRYLDKFGVVELKIVPPLVDKQQKQRIYLAWLGHATAGLNPILKSSQKEFIPTDITQAIDRRYMWLDEPIHIIGLVGPVDMLSKIAVPPDGAKDVEKYLTSYSQIQKLLAEILAEKNRKASTSKRSSGQKHNKAEIRPCGNGAKVVSEKEAQLFQFYDMARTVYALKPYIAASLRPVTEAAGFYIMEGSAVWNLLNSEETLRKYFAALIASEPEACSKLLAEIETISGNSSAYVPKKFQDALDSLIKKQLPYAYAVTPSEVTQRVSNALSAATTMEMALSLAVPKNPVAGDSSAALMASAKETLEGLERFPLVVGFSDRTPIESDLAGRAKVNSKALSQATSSLSDSQAQPTNDSKELSPKDEENRAEKLCSDASGDEGCATFGWVFGPKYQTYSKNGKLEHLIASYDLAADISFPGWWPAIPMQLRTYWVENWKGTTKVLKTEAPVIRMLQVRIPLLTPPDLESLTGALTTEYQGPWGQSPTKSFIEKVYPRAVSACSKEVTFVIEGKNLWRDAEVYWEGIKGTKITVLPGMRGITAHFTIDNFFGAEKRDILKKRIRKTTLLVETRGQHATAPVNFYGHRLPKDKKLKDEKDEKDEKEICDGPTVSAEDEPIGTSVPPPRIHAVAPAILYTCAPNKEVTFVINGTFLTELQNVPVSELTSLTAEAFDKKNVNKPGEVLLGGISAKITKVQAKEDPDTGLSSLQATFLSPLGPNVVNLTGEIRIPLSVVTAGGLDSYDVIIRSCRSESLSKVK
jgi:hypothetical protein